MNIKMVAIMAAVATLLLASVPHILWAVSALAARLFGRHVRYAPFGWVACALAVISLLTILYGVYVGRWKLETTYVEYSHKDVPESFEGYRIVHISDFHLSTFADNPAQLARFVDQVNAARPDLVCFTGDLVSLGMEEALPFAADLQRIAALDGVASVLGNHDFMIYSFRDEKRREAAVQEIVAFERDTLGWNLLRNENMRIRRGEEYITIIGVDNTTSDKQGFKTIARGDLPKASEGTDGFRVLLSHDPGHWMGETVPLTDIQLTLSGHTHAAQIRIFGWTPARWMFDQSDGRYDEGDQTLYVNVGLGGTAPIRLGANPEITVITLHSHR